MSASVQGKSAKDDKLGWLTSETAMLMEVWPRAEGVYALAHFLERSRMAILVHTPMARQRLTSISRRANLPVVIRT